MEFFSPSTNFARTNNRITMEVVKTGKRVTYQRADAPLANADADGGN
jgi:hypothetical protein